MYFRKSSIIYGNFGREYTTWGVKDLTPYRSQSLKGSLLIEKTIGGLEFKDEKSTNIRKFKVSQKKTSTICKRMQGAL